jgi:hypothetical protein
VVLEQLAGGGQLQALAGPGEQARREDLLQLAQGLRDGRLGHGQLVGRPADVAEPRHLQEALEVADLHPRVDHGRLPGRGVGVITARLSARAKGSFHRGAAAQ